MVKEIIAQTETATKTVLAVLKPSESPFYIVTAFGSFALLHTAGAIPNPRWFPVAVLVTVILLWATIGAIRIAGNQSLEVTDSQVKFSRASAISSGMLALAVGGSGSSLYLPAFSIILLLCTVHAAIFMSRFASTRINRGANGVQLSILMGLLLLGASHSLSQSSIRREALRTYSMASPSTVEALRRASRTFHELEDQIEGLQYSVKSNYYTDLDATEEEKKRVTSDLEKTLDQVRQVTGVFDDALWDTLNRVPEEDDWRRAVKLMADTEQPLSVKGAALTLYATFSGSEDEGKTNELLADAKAQQLNYEINALIFISLWLLACAASVRPSGKEREPAD